MAEIFIPANGQLREDIAERVLPEGLYRKIENGVEYRRSAIRKRLGTSVLTRNILAGGSVSSAFDIFNSGRVLLQSSGTELYSWDESESGWTLVNSYFPLLIDEDTLIPANAYTYGSTATFNFAANGSGAYALATGDVDVAGTDYAGYTVISTVTGQPIVPWTSLGLLKSAFIGRVVCSVTGGWVILALDTTGGPYVLRGFFVSSAFPTTPPTSLTLYTEPGIPWLAGYVARDGIIAHTRSAASGSGYIVGFLGAGGITGGVTRHAGSAVSVRAVAQDGNGNVYVFGAFPGGSNLDVEVFDSSLNLLVGSTAVSATAAQWGYLTGAALSATSVQLFHTVFGAVESEDYTVSYSINSAATVATIGTLRGVSVAAEAISGLPASASPNPTVVMKNTTNPDTGSAGGGYTGTGTSLYSNTYFLINQNLKVIGRFGFGEAGTADERLRCYTATPFQGSADVNSPWIFPLAMTSGQNGAFPQTGFRLVSIRGDMITRTTEVGGSLIMTGGLLQEFDSGLLSELGFNMYPQYIQVAEAAGGLSPLPDGTYLVTAVYKWTDMRGRVHRSIPAEPVTLVALGAVHGVDIDVAALRLTEKTRLNSFPAEVEIEVYITNAGGTLYYLAGTEENDTTADSVTVLLNATDLDSGIPLYTDLGEVDNVPPPPPRDIANDGTRIIVAGSRKDLWLGKLYSQSTPVQFNDSFQLPIANDAGAVNGISVIGGSLVVMQPRRLTRFYGATLNNAGGGAFPAQDDLPSNFGPALLWGYLRSSLGIFMMSESGLFLLDAGFSSQDASMASEDLLTKINAWGDPAISDSLSQELRDMTEVGKTARAYFAAEDDYAVVFDVKRQAWTTAKYTSVFADFRGYGTYENALAWVDKDAFVYYEDGTTYRDDGSNYSLAIETGYIRLGGLVGFKRVKKVIVMVTVLSAHTLTITLTNEDGTTEARPFTLAAGDVGKTVSLEIVPANQKTASLKIAMVDSLQASPYSAYEFLGIGVDYLKKTQKTRRRRS